MTNTNMYNNMCRYEHDRNEVINRVSLHRFSSDDYIVNHPPRHRLRSETRISLCRM